MYKWWKIVNLKTDFLFQKVKRDAGVDTLVESIDQLANRIFGEADWDRLPELFLSQKDCLVKVLLRKCLLASM